MADNYGKLTKPEKAHWDEFCRMREISDNQGFTDEQDERKSAAKSWCQNRREEIEAAATGEKQTDDGPGWDVNNRRERYDQLADSKLNSGSCRRKASLPKGENWNVEKVYIREREMWWQVTSETDAQRERKETCTEWLVNRRKRIWREAEGTVETDAGPGWEKKNRRPRYENLCIATKYGSAYEDWQKGHNDNTGEPNKPSQSPKEKLTDHHEKRVGYTEQPDGSNCDTRPDGIRESQDRTAGSGTWLRYQPWCGCWCFYGLQVAGVKGLDSHMASVAQIEDYARQGAKCYRGWTTDRSKVSKGDLAIVGGYGVHVETVRGFDGSNTLTWGGNTSPGSSGSQSNGGGAYKRTRSSSEVRGYALIDWGGA